ncbi:hemerythrin domain-containing protein [Evansella cellulosilytica]|uniref:Hemerythrin HHE cation binding domain protein n=1 Tax=Evansella cellulosilytica (strain ATCC 21833 / DSM 2522 / FERM P-1141 / JCM 9156 / N-4) TaxID=649639 RepID=E6TXY9_EVAC2|nr:hemerythrin domain-containing protein [Evansella cellulosilytica]ADU31202.1 Hemerythrin HHE cation binding domain protein [Evansella cellulosilytica DSM 2522]
MTEFHGCLHSGIIKPEVYCEAIQQLLEEHTVLRKEMTNFYYLASQLAYEPKRKDRHELLKNLANQIETFHKNIVAHSIKEGSYLFDVVAKYIGREDGPIEVMEKEHQIVKRHLNQFLKKYPNINGNIPEDIRELTSHIAAVFHTLTDHILKEEEVLFPLAEELLSDAEKNMLEDRFKEIKVY